MTLSQLISGEKAALYESENGSEKRRKASSSVAVWHGENQWRDSIKRRNASAAWRRNHLRNSITWRKRSSVISGAISRRLSDVAANGSRYQIISSIIINVAIAAAAAAIGVAAAWRSPLAKASKKAAMKSARNTQRAKKPRASGMA